MEDLKKATEISLEELIEKEVGKLAAYPGWVSIRVWLRSLTEYRSFQRQALSSQNQTKVTLQSFVAWKKRKLREKKEKLEAEEKAKKEKVKSGKHVRFSSVLLLYPF